MSTFKFLSLISILTIIAGTFLFVTACQLSEEDARIQSSLISYFKDYQTNICFATMASDSKSLTCVPCTKEVESLLVNKLKSDSACKN